MTIGRIIDVSSAQHPNGAAIDWAQVAEAGVTAAFIKATQGTTYVNPYFQPDMLAAQKAGIAVCAYHFADMTDPVAEAQYFAKIASRFARVLDYETNTNVAWARTFLQTLGRPPSELVTYGSLSTLKDFYAQLPSMAWVAAYQSGWPGFGVCWQFSDSAEIPGISAPVDENQWKGDETQYETLFQLGTQPPEPIGASDMAITASFVHNGQKQVVQASIGSLWHKWFQGASQLNETLAGPGGGTAEGCEDFKVTVASSQPGITNYSDGSVDITFEGTDNSAWLVSQAAGASAWTGGRLA